MTFSATDRPQSPNKTDSWLTPLWVIQDLGGDFDLDPCGFKFHKTADEIFQLPQNGLKIPWHGKVWLNPPYSDVKTWLDKLATHGHGTALVFNRADTKTMQEHFKKASSVFFMEGRISFLREDLSSCNNAGTGSMLLSYGYTPDYSKLRGWKAK